MGTGGNGENVELPRLHRPRWLFRFHARLFGYFWLPCPACGRAFSGWEWGRDDHTVWDGTSGHGVCSEACAHGGRSTD